MIAGELIPGETVGLELQTFFRGEPLRARAVVRHQDKLRCGLEFVGLSPEQRSAIRDWVKVAKREPEVSTNRAMAEGRKNTEPLTETGGNSRGPKPGKRKKRARRLAWIIVLVSVAITAGIFWWRWNRAWEELESGLKGSQTISAPKPQAQVPAEVMQRLLIHRVEPVYPAEARQARLEGTIALDLVVGRDGTVVSMRALNGPDVLARAAMDALRWWKFEPYRVNGEPAVVETTVAVEFKR
jgi:TonB family protein